MGEIIKFPSPRREEAREESTPPCPAALMVLPLLLPLVFWTTYLGDDDD